VLEYRVKNLWNNLTALLIPFNILQDSDYILITNYY
jgi:hypothetical protein